MYLIPLEAIPNQSCSVRLDGSLLTLTVKAGRNLMVASIERDGHALVKGVRCLPETPLIPHRYLEGLTGNFYFLTEAGAYPHYTRFGLTDRLCYLTHDELKELRNA